MPELPEVETTRRGLAPWLEGQRIERLVVRQRQLRWPIPRDMPQRLAGQTVTALDRRGKYLLMRTGAGTALMHLGMSGSMRILPAGTTPGRHDHFDLVLGADRCVRFSDPRRFGALLWTARDPLRHPLLASLGPEPLGPGFDGEYLWQRTRGRRVAIKVLLMNAAIVVGIGNIYASEALFRAGIDPRRAASRLSRATLARLVAAVREVLGEAVALGGTTLRDFHDGHGEPGYFSQQLRVYDRTGQPCRRCGTPVRHLVQGQRSTWFCPACQR